MNPRQPDRTPVIPFRGRMFMDLVNATVLFDALPESIACYVAIQPRGTAVPAHYVWDGYALTPASMQLPGAAFPVAEALIADVAARIVDLTDRTTLLSMALAVTLGPNARIVKRSNYANASGDLLSIRIEAPALDVVVNCEEAVRRLAPMADAPREHVRSALLAIGHRPVGTEGL